MEESYRLKIKLGADEFEAEGPSDLVKEQFQLFKDLVQSRQAAQVAQAQNQAPPASNAPLPSADQQDAPQTDLNVSKIMGVSGRVVSLTVPPKSPEDAVLLIVYGQRLLRGNDSVTGSEVMDGLTTTGGMNVDRVDRLLQKIGADGDLIITGERRGKRYRLTNTGIAKARQIAQDLIALVP